MRFHWALCSPSPLAHCEPGFRAEQRLFNHSHGNFILAEAASFYPKLRTVLTIPIAISDAFGRITGTMNRYIAIKTSVSVLTGLLVTTFLWILNVDFPVLWGLVALLLNFIPTIGSITRAFLRYCCARAAWPHRSPAGSSWIFHGEYDSRHVLNLATWVGGLTVPLVVFLSLIFWGWLLGPVGMLLSVPLTMSAKIARRPARARFGLLGCLHPHRSWLTRRWSETRIHQLKSSEREPV